MDSIFGAVGRRSGALFFARHLETFIVTQSSQSLPGLGTFLTASSCTRTLQPSTRTGKKRSTATLRYRSGQAPTATNQTAGPLVLIFKFSLNPNSMKKILFTLSILVVISACATQKIASTKSETGSTISSNDGSSFEKAIIINENREKAGVDAEYAWIYKNYPGCKVSQQSLTENKKIPYDILKIVTADGQQKSIYFNISKFFGKF
jgi:hypothetical protein